MVDSINFNVDNISIKDIKIPEDVEVKTFQNKKVKNIRLQNGMQFFYKNIGFYYYPHIRKLVILANPHKVLNKRDIKVSDLNEYDEKLNKILNEVIDLNKFTPYLSRFDYCVDVYLGELVNVYTIFFNWNKQCFKYMKKENEFSTSLYLKTKRGKRNLNIYNRKEKTQNPKDEGILRVEVQGKKKLIKNEPLTSYKEYWTKEAMEHYFFDFLKDFFYVGDYYKLGSAKQIIKSSNFTEFKKYQLENFLKDVQDNTLGALFKDKKYTYGKIMNRVKKLNNLEINPIVIPESFGYDTLTGIFTLLKITADRLYFQ